MGVYLNPGNVDFQEVLNSKIYVDKSTKIRKVYGSEYADGLLQPWL